MPRYLTKSRFKLAQECPAKLYYTRKDQYPDENEENEFLESLAEGGFQVGELAKLMHPEGLEHDIHELDHEASLARTNELLQRENVTIFEAAIRYENLFIRIDILKKRGNAVELIEVKAKSFDGDDHTEMLQKRQPVPDSDWRPYLEDVAFQKYVLSKAFPGYRITSYLMLADKNATASVNGLNQQFKIRKNGQRKYVEVAQPLLDDPARIGAPVLRKVNVDPVVDIIWEEKDDNGRSFEERIHWLAEHYDRDKKISIPIGRHCDNCEFRATAEQKAEGQRSGFEECWKEQLGWSDADFEKPHLFDVWKLHHQRKDALLTEGKYFIENLAQEDIDEINPLEPPNSPLTTTQRQWLQVQKVQERDATPYIDREGLRAEMESWNYPLHFIDFETSMAAIPFHKGMRPYEQVAFQFSHHRVDANGHISHANEFIHIEPGEFPNFEFARKLRDAIGQDDGTIFRYSHHENTILCKIWEQLENSNAPDRAELQDFIQSISHATESVAEEWEGPRDMVDLWDLVKKYYYHPATNGSNSIKQVLPAILNESDHLKEKYSQPIYGTEQLPSLNFENHRWIEFDGTEVIDPYKKLPPVLKEYDEAYLEQVGSRVQPKISDGGAAMMAYSLLQFGEYDPNHVDAIKQALLRYCELDTMAMVFIWEYWKEVVKI